MEHILKIFSLLEKVKISILNCLFGFKNNILLCLPTLFPKWSLFLKLSRTFFPMAAISQQILDFKSWCSWPWGSTIFALDASIEKSPMLKSCKRDGQIWLTFFKIIVSKHFPLNFYCRIVCVRYCAVLLKISLIQEFFFFSPSFTKFRNTAM